MMPPIVSLDTQRVLALRSQILGRNAALTPPAQPAGTGFGGAITAALQSVNGMQAAAGDAASAFERGDTSSIAQVMLTRQKASIAFEATLQVRNKLLSAYKDIMSMPV